jgi:hypothetical protein
MHFTISLPAIAGDATRDIDNAADKAALAITLGSLSERFMMISCAMSPWCLPRPPLSVRSHTLARVALWTRRQQVRSAVNCDMILY